MTSEARQEIAESGIYCPANEIDQGATALPWALRIVSLIAGIFAMALLITSSQLEPSTEGFGTHEQLGLPPCTSIYVWGTRCPACGMTTSWAWATRLNVVESFRANAGGLMLAIIALAYIPSSCYFFLCGKASRGGRFSLCLAIFLTAALLAAIIQWGWRISLGL